MLGFPQLIQPRKILDKETVVKIEKELRDPGRFNSYKEIQLWLLVCQDIN
ncbi:hypothetical protein CY0110_12482 [Crocosphaera chwakensis CCY0110]|uniref:Uncharacterized protein n=1 Tax=Crocosphaera chwakensis CCY0110 TaxID=391612 RepID=A3IY07_9CHRO|nr:hypothetical protein CY0110_12482 [Crocosphaera chwakensis CCY0110]